MQPKLSVALPVYNGANFLAEALDSVLAQRFEDFELVVSDNCSTDDTPRILEEYARRDARVRVVRSDEFLAQADNVNRSVALCNTEWVKLFCHDDLMKPDCLEVVWRAASDVRAGTVGLIGNGEEWLFENGYCYSPEPTSAEAPLAFFAGRDFLQASLTGRASAGLPSLTTATVRKTAWEAEKGFDKRYSHFDVFLWTKLLLRWDYLATPAVLTTNRIHSGQVAVSARKSLKSIKDHRLFWPEFLAENQQKLALDRRSAFLTRLKPVSVAGTTMAVQWLKGNYPTSLGILLRLPIAWWPLLPAFAMRSFIRERNKVSSLRQHVSLDQIYPN